MKKIVLLCKALYFRLPCVKYSGAGGWKYYKEVLGIYIDPAEIESSFPKWYKPWMSDIDNRISEILLKFLKRNRTILRDDYYKNRGY